MKNPKVTIIGAGPAGLALGCFLARQNTGVVIYEGSKQIGGLAGSVEFAGQHFDIGPHIFLESSQPPAVQFWKEIGGKDLQRLSLKRGMLLNKRLIPYPPRPGGLMRAMGIFPFCIAGVSALKARLWPQAKKNNAADFFSRYYGNYFRKRIFDPYCEKYMGIPARQVALDFATGLTSFVKEAGKTDVMPEKQKLNSLLYNKYGTKKMWDNIAGEVTKTGEILLEKKISGISTNGRRISGISFSDGSTEQPEFLVSTLALGVFLKLLDHCPQDVLDAARKLESRNTVLLYLRIKQRAFAYQYVTVFDHSLKIGRITNFNAWQQDKNNKTHTVLCVEYWCSNNDDTWRLDDENLLRNTMTELKDAGLISEQKVLDFKVLRLANSHPVLTVDYQQSLQHINNYLAQFENLALTGRHAGFKWDGQADNIISGMQLAEKIIVALKKD